MLSRELGVLTWLISEKTVDSTGEMIGVVVCKLEPHRGGPLRGYIAMLAVKKEHRGKGIATELVRMAIDAMIVKDADEVCISSLRLHILILTCDRLH